MHGQLEISFQLSLRACRRTTSRLYIFFVYSSTVLNEGCCCFVFFIRPEWRSRSRMWDNTHVWGLDWFCWLQPILARTRTHTHTHQVSHDMHWYWWFFLNQLHKYDWVVTGGSPISPLCLGRAWGAPKEKNPESIEALKWNLEPPCDGSKWVELTGRRPICGTFCTSFWHFIRPSTENHREILWCYVSVFVLKRDTDLTPPPNHQHHQDNIV